MGIVQSVINVFVEISDWFGSAITDLGSIFYTVNEGVYELTIFGVLAVMSLGVGLILLIFRIVTDFFGWRR